MKDATDNPTSDDLVIAIARRLKDERQRQGMSASALARRAGIAKSTLTQLEASKGNPSVETLWALAVALDVPFAQLIQMPQPDIRVLRAGEGVTTRAEETDFTARLLSSCPSGVRHNLYRIELAADAARRSDAHMSGTVEHIVVTEGRLRVGPADNPADLGVGDYMRFAGDVAHVYIALDAPAAALMIMEYP